MSDRPPLPDGAMLPSGTTFRLVRAFAAPRARVWQAMTEPSHLRQWYRPAGGTLETCEMDVRPGGAWRWVTDLGDGKTMTQRGVYREVDAPRCIVNTESWDDGTLAEIVVSTLFDDQEDGAQVTTTLEFPDTAARDRLLGFGMAEGMVTAYDTLAAYLIGGATDP